MSSGETAKPPELGGHNPFDLSRRSEQEVAAEIAARVAAWKQARGSSGRADAAAQHPAVQAPGDPRPLPKFGEHADTPRPVEERERSAVSSNAAARPAPFAPFAMMRTMPPSPSFRRSAPRIEPTIQAPDAETPKIAAPRLEIAEWDARPPVPSARAPSRHGSGSGWAILLGAALLILGVASPAAIWRQWRMEAPVVLSQADTASRPAPTADRTARLEEIDWLRAIADGKAEIAATPAGLIAVPSGGELAAAPISVPQFPPPEAASKPAPTAKPRALPVLAEHEVPPFPLVPRPFQPEWTAKPFRPAPVGGAAGLPALKQDLAVQEKRPPAKAAVGMPQETKPKLATRQDAPQSLDQMFDALLDTLAAGQPTTPPAKKPIHPSNRR